MAFYGVGRTDCGSVRPINEDTLFLTNEVFGIFPNLFIIADGIGGSLAGEVASERTVFFVSEFIKSVKSSDERDFQTILYDALNYANSQVYKLSIEKSEYSQMGTTAIVATVVESLLIFAHIGDSRLYTITGNEIIQQTEDHNFANEMVRTGNATREEAEKLGSKNALVKWVGAPEEISPDIKAIELSENTSVLICTDGLSNMLEPDEICSIINNDISKEDKVKTLVQTANQNGGRDNITVILI